MNTEAVFNVTLVWDGSYPYPVDDAGKGVCISLPASYPYSGFVVVKRPGAVLWELPKRIRLGAMNSGLWLKESFGTEQYDVGWVNTAVCHSPDGHLMKWCICFKQGVDRGSGSQVE